MSIKDAVVLRFRHLCMERLITWNELATRSGVTPSTVYSMLDPRLRELSVVTVKTVCDGLEISISVLFGD